MHKAGDDNILFVFAVYRVFVVTAMTKSVPSALPLLLR
jgi:hypothetical protein